MTILSKPYCHLLWTGGVLWKLSSILLFILLNVNTCICITDGNVTTDIKNVLKRPIHLNLVYNGIFQEKFKQWWGGGDRHGCSNHSNLEMKAECLMKTMSYLNSNISRTKNGRNARIKKSYRIY